ncbi:MAG: hypothetical protein LBI31_00350 [Zoogloeaceae bacterium]|jgi:hypothetical protein|nr:hypothetical protein [Zoogloeaceae bacterium]
MEKTACIVGVLGFIFASACLGDSLEISQTTIQEETEFGTLPPEVQKVLSDLMRNPEFDVDIYDKANAVTIGKYRILFIPDNPETPIFIVKDKKALMGVIGSSKVIFADSPLAPTLEGVRVEVVDDSFMWFTNRKKRFESYGFGGIDVIKDMEDTGVPGGEAYRNNVKCPYSLRPSVSCCYDDEGVIRPYEFKPSRGWEISGIKKLVEFCETSQKTPLPNSK